MQRTFTRILLAIVLLALPLTASQARAEDKLKVEIAPAAPSVGKHAHDHDIKIDALKKDKTGYLLQSAAEDSHRISLTRKQVANILDGTTIIVRTEGDGDGGIFKAHRHRVSITFQAEEQESSGW